MTAIAVVTEGLADAHIGCRQGATLVLSNLLDRSRLSTHSQARKRVARHS